MRYFGGLMIGLGLAVVLAAPGSARGEDKEPKAFGKGPAYEALGKLAVMHEGRIKPLDTLAREEVKQIFGRETIKLLDSENKAAATWTPVAAMFDWTVRPSFWNDQPIILVEYVPLKRFILAEEIENQLLEIAAKTGTSNADRDALRKLAADPAVNVVALRSFLATAKLGDDDKAAVEGIASLLSEEHKWLSAEQIEAANVSSEPGKKVPFQTWFRDVVAKKREADESVNGEPKLTEIEKRGYEAGIRLVHFQSIRDRTVSSVMPLLVMPRPSGPEYLKGVAKLIENAPRNKEEADQLPILQQELLSSLSTYWNDIPRKDRAVPGSDKEADAKYAAWLKGQSVWIPLRVFLDSPKEALTAVGYPANKLDAFLNAFKEFEKAEAEAPGEVAEAKAVALTSAARALGESVNDEMYPNTESIARETFFNKFNPFWMAWPSYFLATALLAGSLVFVGNGKSSLLGKVGLALYGLGMASMLAAMGLEVVGFYLRVRISGWAPVTNMYETVIWVSLVAAILGLTFEGIYRKTFAALAGSATAMLGTVLAANVPLLDPEIKSLQPVLRSNYWLTIHVLTEVSSYGAFLMAAVLGLIATLYYLTATYRRSPSYTELALPLAPGLPLFAVGTLGLMASQGSFGENWVTGNFVFYLSALLAGSGGMLVVAACCAIFGEIIARFQFVDDKSVEVVSVASDTQSEAARLVRENAMAGAAVVGQSGSGSTPAVVTLPKPSVAEIRAMSAANRPKLDARGRAMQETAQKIKPLANFIYRTMQVGVLLIAAGTILGGVWADYSWGRFWGWDPKEVWALITLLVYLIPLHGRFAGWFNTFALVVASVVCSLSVIMAWYGVNFVLGVGLHSYGFVEGGGQGVVSAVLAAVLAIPVGAAWRRALGSRVPAVATA